MNRKLMPLLKILLIQTLLTIIVVFPFRHSDASIPNASEQQADQTQLTTVREHINSYLYEGENIDLSKELELQRTEFKNFKIASITIKAQAIERNAILHLRLNNKAILKSKLSDHIEEIQFKLPRESTKLKLELLSKGAFITIAKVKLVSEKT